MADAEKGIKWMDEQIDRKPQMRSAIEYRELVEQLWIAGLPPGSKTGWPSVDKHYTVCPGQMTIVTGWPGAGKSEWMDALMVNLTRQDWKFAVFSAENMPVEVHIAKLMEKLAGRPFGEGVNERIGQGDIGEYCDLLDSSIRFISQRNDAVTVQDVVKLSERWLFADDGKKRGLLIDPWNELDHWRRQGISETEYIGETLSYVRNWARANQVHVWIVAHPQKVPREGGKLPPPRPDMISGSQHWWNKADCAVAVWRDPDKPELRTVDICVQKVRFKHIGTPGIVSLDYDRVTGRYSEPNAKALFLVAKDGKEE